MKKVRRVISCIWPLDNEVEVGWKLGKCPVDACF